MKKLWIAFRWTRGNVQAHYATAVQAAGWLLAAWEVLIDRFHTPSVLSGAAGMILFKSVKKGTSGKDES